MKKCLYFPILLMFVCNFCYCQEITCSPPKSSIKSSKANNRSKKYRNYKKLSLFNLTGKTEIDGITFSKSAFLQLLENLHGANVDGFRIYFATYPVIPNNDSGYNYVTKDYSDCFTFIFVPTINHVDDTKHCWIMYNNHPFCFDAEKADGKFISQWIYKYDLSRAAYFNIDGNGYLNKGVWRLPHRQRYFRETESMWYKEDTRLELYNYINCDNSNISVQSIDLNLGSYLFKSHPWSYNLTLIFGIKYKIIKNGNLLPATKETFVSIVQNTDTGKPCPPPNTGCKTEGALLPINQ